MLSRHINAIVIAIGCVVTRIVTGIVTFSDATLEPLVLTEPLYVPVGISARGAM